MLITEGTGPFHRIEDGRIVSPNFSDDSGEDGFSAWDDQSMLVDDTSWLWLLLSFWPACQWILNLTLMGVCPPFMVYLNFHRPARNGPVMGIIFGALGLYFILWSLWSFDMCAWLLLYMYVFLLEFYFWTGDSYSIFLCSSSVGNLHELSGTNAWFGWISGSIDIGFKFHSVNGPFASRAFYHHGTFKMGELISSVPRRIKC